VFETVNEISPRELEAIEEKYAEVFFRNE